MAKYIAQVFVLGAQVIGRAFARALQQEFSASRTAAQSGGTRNARATVDANLKLGMTLQEAKQILNVNELSSLEIEKSYKHLFEVNDRSKGGSLYLQSKIVRAKERLDEELNVQKEETVNHTQKKDETN